MKAFIDSEKCIGCGRCASDCPMKRLELKNGTMTCNDSFCIGCGHCYAVCPCHAVGFDEADTGDVVEYSEQNFKLDPDVLFNFIRFRRSIRHFTKEDVTDEQIGRLIESGRYAPTGSNLQKIRYVVLKDRLSEITELSLRALFDTAVDEARFKACGAADYYRTRWIRMYESYKTEGLDSLFFNAPCVILVIDTVKQHDTSSVVSSGLAASNIEQMANALGLGACYVGFFIRAIGIDPSIGKAIGLLETERLTAVLAVGHPDVQYYRTVPRNRARVTYM